MCRKTYPRHKPKQPGYVPRDALDPVGLLVADCLKLWLREATGRGLAGRPFAPRCPEGVRQARLRRRRAREALRRAAAHPERVPALLWGSALLGIEPSELLDRLRAGL